MMFEGFVEDRKLSEQEKLSPFKTEQIILSDTDRAILNSCEMLVDGLAEYLGDGFEIVLHSMESFDCSIIKIANGHHTGRKLGSPITNLALSLYNKIINGEEDKTYVTYHATNNKGEPFYSTTMVIRGEYDRVIGILCVNFSLNTPLVDIFRQFSGNSVVEREHSLNENFFENVDEMLELEIDQASKEVEANESILPSNRNREIIRLLYMRGLFSVKGAIPKIANSLGLSKNTIYLHLRYARQAEKESKT